MKGGGCETRCGQTVDPRQQSSKLVERVAQACGAEKRVSSCAEVQGAPWVGSCSLSRLLMHRGRRRYAMSSATLELGRSFPLFSALDHALRTPASYAHSSRLPQGPRRRHHPSASWRAQRTARHARLDVSRDTTDGQFLLRPILPQTCSSIPPSTYTSIPPSTYTSIPHSTYTSPDLFLPGPAHGATVAMASQQQQIIDTIFSMKRKLLRGNDCMY
jgi:hypothetical protein